MTATRNSKKRKKKTKTRDYQEFQNSISYKPQDPQKYI